MVGDETSCASKIVGDVQVGGDLEKAAARSVGVQRKKTPNAAGATHREKQTTSQETH